MCAMILKLGTAQSTACCCCSTQGLKSAGLDGVLLGGNYVAGVALGKCVEYGFEFAEQTAQFVVSQQGTRAETKQKVAA